MASDLQKVEERLLAMEKRTSRNKDFECCSPTKEQGHEGGQQDPQ